MGVHVDISNTQAWKVSEAVKRIQPLQKNMWQLEYHNLVAVIAEQEIL